MRLLGRAVALVPALLSLPDGRHARPACVCRGDVVQIVADVKVKGVNTRGMVGEIEEDLDEVDAEEWGACCEVRTRPKPWRRRSPSPQPTWRRSTPRSGERAAR